jgi:nucleoside-diphosphate-sugar epimerase
MNILVTGGYGFIGSFVAEKFYREGHKVFILDNLSTGDKNNINFRHQSAILDVEHAGCEEIFRVNKFDIVIHLAAQADVTTSLENPVLDAKTNVYGLSNMLYLAKKYGVRKFIFASSAAVYGFNENIPLIEQETCNPISPYGLNKWVGESYCRKWSEMYNLETLCFRFSNVYGPRQSSSGEGGVISIFINNILDKKSLTVFGDGTQTRDFIYVEDVAEAIYRSVLSHIDGILNLSSNEEVSINKVLELLGGMTEFTEVNQKDWRHDEIMRSCLDNTAVTRQLDWVPKYSFKDGLEKTYQWFLGNTVEATPPKSRFETLFSLLSKIKSYAPYLENAFLFLLTVLLELTAQKAFESIDFKILYILFIGIWLGRSQSILASGLTIVLYVYDNLANGRDFISLFIDNETILNFAIYIFIGIVSGYVIDKKNAREQSTRLELEALQNKHHFLSEIYHETRLLKDELQAQIVNSEDSIGKVYSIVKKLDSLEPEQIFNETVTVLEQTLKTDSVALYVVGQTRQFLRLVSNSKNPSLTLSRSLKVDDSYDLKKVVEQNKLFINRKLQSDTPMIMAPIMKDDRTIAVICIYHSNFEQLTLHYQNLLKVVMNLISDSLSRAYEYLQATNKERYTEGTMILKPSYFIKLLENKTKLKERLGIDFSVVEVPWTPDYKQNIHLLENSLRETDYMGMNEHGHTFILFSNTNEKDVENVIRRLERLGVPVKKIQKELMYV